MKNKDGISRQIWVFFCSVKLTVYILVLLAVTSIIGTVVLQNGSPQQYVNLYGEGIYNLIQVFDLDDMYHAWWFLLLLLVLCINITVCSVERLSLLWKTIFPGRVRFNVNRYLKSKSSQTIDTTSSVKPLLEPCESWLAKQAGPVIRQTDGQTTYLYAEKGRWTRLGVFVVHASVLLLLAGALIGAVFGFKANVRIDEGTQTGRVFESKTREPITLDFIIRCNEFDVSFYENGAPEEFRSNLTIIEGGQESLTTDIRVNHPLRYKGINIFQSSYGTAAPDTVTMQMVDNQSGAEILRDIRIGETIDLPDGAGQFTLQGFLPHFEFREHDLGETFFGLVTLAGETGFQIGMPIQFPTFDKMRKGRFTFVVTDFEKRYYTGLQVTKDPGVWYVYAGFILMILGCWVTFFMSHQSFLLTLSPRETGGTRVVLSGKSSRNSRSMTLKLKQMATRLENQLNKGE
ncbi:cytochrome c biogenesis protein ResB [Desulfotignum phosphitoxidans]|uniref:Transmembrane cytochrome c biogenesis protein ResB n=1 Tax=Desulfotignum phosphitoxidans DSM 13687 TaxID=1286635 RepID=S0FZI0_9BACT|nr:cytochrome c biogenesis protein ResB [Desulfotignum phosphitoxidans]EMS80543.1 transmembrane cytochrome c biogenesis protein ResB [Desulfotignum phosphitoxidans DSM 13687]